MGLKRNVVISIFYMSNGLTFEIRDIILRNFQKMAFAKFQENRFRIDGEIAKNHAILVNLTASIATKSNALQYKDLDPSLPRLQI